MKRVLYIILVVVLLGALGYMGYQFQQKTRVKPEVSIFDFVPNSAVALIHTNNGPFIFNEIASDNQVYKQLNSISAIAQLTNHTALLDSLSTSLFSGETALKDNSYILSWHPVGIGFAQLHILQLQSKEEIDRLMGALVEQNSGLQLSVKTYDDTKIYTVKGDSSFEGLAFAFIEGCFMASTSSILLEQVTGHVAKGIPITEQADFKTIYKTMGKKAYANCFIHYSEIADWVKPLLIKEASDKFTLFNHFGNWIELDVNISEKTVLLNGFSNFSTSDYLSLFKNEQAIGSDVASVLPVATTAFISLGIENMSSFRELYQNYLKSNDMFDSYQTEVNRIKRATNKDVRDVFDNLFENEIVRGYGTKSTTENSGFIILKLKSHREAEEQLTELLEGYARKSGTGLSSLKQSVKIDKDFAYVAYRIPFKDMFKTLYGDMFGGFDQLVVTLYNNHLIAAGSYAVLSDIIYNNVLKRTLEDDPNFKKFKANLAGSSNILFYCNSLKLTDVISEVFKPKVAKGLESSFESLGNLQAVAVQLSGGGDLIYANCFTNYNPNQIDAPQTLWQSKLDSSFLQKPSLVTNHYTLEKEICLQDKENNLYLISRSGRVLWKRPLDSRIMGDVKQIDLYKNKKFQMLFNTRKRLFLIDRNGNDVENYPVRLPANATNEVSVFDYEGTRNYRLFLACDDKKVYLFDKYGKKNSGWKFGKTDHEVKTPIQHFRVKEKDYIIFKDKYRVYIQDRKGRTRIKLKEQFASNNKNMFYLAYPDKFDSDFHFVTIDTAGVVKKIYLTGSVASVKLPEVKGGNYFVFDDMSGDGSADYILLDDNILWAFDENAKKIMSYNFNNRINYVPAVYKFTSGENKVGVVDDVKNNIYLINSDGSLHKGFPLRGCTPFSIGFMSDENRRFNLFVGGNDNYLYNYIVN